MGEEGKIMLVWLVSLLYDFHKTALHPWITVFSILMSDPSSVPVRKKKGGGVDFKVCAKASNSFQLPNSFGVQWDQVLAYTNFFCLSIDFINLALQMEEEPFNPDYVEVDRVLEVSLCEDKDTGEVNTF